MNGIQDCQKLESAQNANQPILTKKRCSRCKKKKSVDLFGLHKQRKDGYRCYCKKCSRIIDRGNYKKNIESRREKSLSWYHANQDRCKDRNRIWRKNNPEKHKLAIAKWRERNHKRNLEIHRRACKKHGSTPKGRLNSRMSTAIYKSLRGNKNKKKWQEIVGYSVCDLKNHLEKQFTEGMTWERFLNAEIHIDHIVPKAVFNFEKPEDDDFKRCWDIKNLQPLWAIDNSKKGKRLNKPFQPGLVFK